MSRTEDMIFYMDGLQKLNSITIKGEMYLLIGWFGWGEHLY